ncbi:hypothetical protein [Brachybacterium paraconglomeratum]|uniref:hypothetical protein n=1 Tax=Brachybacterium paraconglomeratum TaxID=173362 RepID=UPI0022AFAB06|nr:hypothetical protein [Brachybacterium paraconglomeratum]MCZ4326770.1 hypothetical protein [Brachybacterium paraconglomeratum]
MKTIRQTAPTILQYLVYRHDDLRSPVCTYQRLVHLELVDDAVAYAESRSQPVNGIVHVGAVLIPPGPLAQAAEETKDGFEDRHLMTRDGRLVHAALELAR